MCRYAEVEEIAGLAQRLGLAEEDEEEDGQEEEEGDEEGGGEEGEEEGGGEDEAFDEFDDFAEDEVRAIPRLHLGSASAASRLHLGCISASPPRGRAASGEARR